MTQFTVNASAEASSPPERGIITLTIEISSENREAAYAKAIELHNSLVALALEYVETEVATWHTASAPRSFARKETWHTDGEGSELRSKLTYTTSSSIQVRFKDFTVLGEWLAALSDSAHTGVNSHVTWALTETTKTALQKKVRTQAVVNARELASDYAAGDGIDTSKEPLKLISISDEDPPMRFNGHSPLRGFVGSASAPVADISPEDITVSAAVIAVFES